MGLIYQFIDDTPYASIIGSKLLAPKSENLSAVKFLYPDQVSPVSKLGVSPPTEGYPVDPATMPTAVSFESKNKALPDVFKVRMVNIVSERVRNVIERFEPGIHQFIPVDMYRPKAKEPFARHYWMIVCRRIDSVDPVHTTIPRKLNRLWAGGDGGEFVFSLSAIGDAHLWCDPDIGTIYNDCSQALGDALKEMGVTGLRLKPSSAI